MHETAAQEEAMMKRWNKWKRKLARREKIRKILRLGIKIE